MKSINVIQEIWRREFEPAVTMKIIQKMQPKKIKFHFFRKFHMKKIFLLNLPISATIYQFLYISDKICATGNELKRIQQQETLILG